MNSVFHNPEAEHGLLGTMLFSRDAALTATDALEPEDFYAPNLGHIFRAASAVVESGAPLDVLTLAAELDRVGLLDEVGGRAALIGLAGAAPASANAERYAEMISDHATLRRLAAAGERITGIATSGSTAREAVERANTELFGVSAEDRRTDVTRVAGLVEDTVAHLEHLSETKGRLTGVPTGVPDLDVLTRGWQPSTLIVVGARPAVGKTAFSLGCALTAARAGVPAMFVSLEMPSREIMGRLISNIGRVDAGRITSGALNNADWVRVADASDVLDRLPLWIMDSTEATVTGIRAKARRVRQHEGALGLIVVDYIQLMTAGGRRENRQVEVADISRGLKKLAREFECPVLALAQLNRSSLGRVDPRPTMADLRESGALEQDADIVLLLHSDREERDRSTSHEVTMIVDKHRAGPTGSLKASFVPRWMDFGAPGEDPGRDGLNGSVVAASNGAANVEF